MAEFLQVVANGSAYDLVPGTGLHDFVRQQGLEPGQVVVELNGRAITPGEAASARLEDGDSLEIVRIVAGG